MCKPLLHAIQSFLQVAGNFFSEEPLCRLWGSSRSAAALERHERDRRDRTVVLPIALRSNVTLEPYVGGLFALEALVELKSSTRQITNLWFRWLG